MSFQQVILLGNLGSDPEMRYTPSGVPVTNFSLAVSRTWSGQDGQRQEKTIWFRVAAWRREAEIASQYLSKGRQVMVIGELEEPRTWQDKEGNTRVSLEVTARQIRLVGGRDGGGGDSAMDQSFQPASGGQRSGGNYSGGGGGNSGGGSNARGNSAPPPSSGGDLTDEDIPF
jgi:single-strand DNA-binding protein